MCVCVCVCVCTYLSDKLVPGTSVFTSSETDILGNFWGHIKGVKYRFALQDKLIFEKKKILKTYIIFGLEEVLIAII